MADVHQQQYMKTPGLSSNEHHFVDLFVRRFYTSKRSFEPEHAQAYPIIVYQYRQGPLLPSPAADDLPEVDIPNLYFPAFNIHPTYHAFPPALNWRSVDCFSDLLRRGLSCIVLSLLMTTCYIRF